jgi:hypothetical protein
MQNPLDALPEHAYDEVRAELERIYNEYTAYPSAMERRTSGGDLWAAAEYLATQNGVTVSVYDEERRRTSAAWAAYWVANAIFDRRFTNTRHGGWWPTDDPELAAGAPPRPTRGSMAPIVVTWHQLGTWLATGTQTSLFPLAA